VSLLDGLRVVDLTMFLPGPMLTLMLADHGAQVTKVEPPGGDPARSMGPFVDGQSVWFANLNRGKDCVTLDLKSPAGAAALWDLVDTADVFVEGFRPGAVGRLGFGADVVRARNPRLVYASVSAFGQSGPLADHPAHDLAVQALSGFLSVNDGPDGTPVVPGVPSADLAAGLTALSGILMALLARERTGRGATLDIAMFDSLLPWSAHIAGDALAGGSAPRSASQRSLGGAAFYQVYACADGRHVVLGGREAKFARVLLTALGRPDLIPLAEAPAGEQGELVAFLRTTFATRSRDDWAAWFAHRDVAFAPVLDFAEALAQPHVAARCLVNGHQIASAIRLGSA
jgi:crotonobetainyl-CoA:carnitine CoA-transferase CaiB-like acyl-CoA transferase